MNSKYLAAALLVMTTTPSQLLAQSVSAGIQAWQRSDYAQAVSIWRALAEKGDADAQFNLGQAYRLGRGVVPDLAIAQQWFERAANQGHLDAETTLGLLLFQNGDRAGGLKWLKKAALAGDPRALLIYGTALVNGDGVAQDPVLGYAYVSRAAAQGLAPAKDTLAQLDRIMPPDDRKRGLAIARQLASTAAAASSASAAAKSKTTAAAKPPAQTAGQAPAATAAARSKASARSATAASAPKAPRKTAPESAEAAVTATGGWRIQLGAFSQRSNAEALYRKLSANGALRGRGPFYVTAGAVTRLQVGPFESKAAAGAACKALSVACFPVPAK